MKFIVVTSVVLASLHIPCLADNHRMLNFDFVKFQIEENSNSLNTIESITDEIQDTGRLVEQLEPKLKARRDHSYSNEFLDNIRLFSLEDVIKLTLDQSPSIVESKFIADAQLWQLIAANRQYLPKISLIGSFNNTNKTNRNVGFKTDEGCLQDFCSVFPPFPSALPGIVSYSQYTPLATINWKLFDLSRNADIESERSTFDALRLQATVSARSQVLQSQLDYFKLQSLMYMIAIYQSFIQQSSGFYLANVVDKDDFRLVKLQLYNNINTLLGLYEEMISTSSQLSESMGLSPFAYPLPMRKLSDKYPEWVDDNVLTTIEYALKNSEEIAILKHQRDAEIWLQRKFSRAYLPTLSIDGGVSKEFYNGNIKNKIVSRRGQGTSSAYDATLGLNLEWKFDGLINAAQATSSSMKGQSIEASITQEKLNIASEIQSAFADWKIGFTRINNTKYLVEEQSKALLAKSLMFSDKKDPTTFVVAQTELIRLHDSYSQAVFSVNSGLARLYRSSSIWPPGVEKILSLP